jgi:LemA protein|nr:MAG TPA: LemA family [Caudoviricetes sp.]
MKNKIDWKIMLITATGIIAVVLALIFAVQGSQNKAIALEEQVNTAWSYIKVQEKRRIDLVYNLVDCVKHYDKQEADTLTALVDGRGSAGDIENVTTAITAVAEAYPELRSNENYKALMNELSMTENLIAEYRSNYNKQIKEYRRYVRKFPARMFLEMLGYEIQEHQYLDYDAPSDAPLNLFEEE